MCNGRSKSKTYSILMIEFDEKIIDKIFKVLSKSGYLKYYFLANKKCFQT